MAQNDPLMLQQEAVLTQLLADVQIDSLLHQVAALSGEVPVTIGDARYTIASRNSSQPGNALAARYLYQELQRHGLDPFLHAFNTQGENVLAMQPGTRDPDKFFIICAHYDAMPPGPLSYGADDNASGCAAVLEAARLLRNIPLAYPVLYAFWDEEEQGLIGSKAWAKEAYLAGKQILGVINMDMIAWDGNNDAVVTLQVRPVANSIDLAERLMEINENYGIGLYPSLVNPGSPNSDHSSFWNWGYGALLVIEEYRRLATGNDFNPWYHSLYDRIEADGLKIFNLPYFRKCAQMSIAGLASHAAGLAPAPPLAVSQASETTVRPILTWRRSGMARGYMVDLARDAAFATVDQRILTGSDTACVPLRLQYNTPYFWRVRSRNRTGSGEWGPVYDFQTNGPVAHRLTVPGGWNLIASPVAPDDSTLVALLAGRMVIVRDAAGRRYAPDRGWDELHYWNSTQGYWIWSADSLTLDFSGWEINAAPAPLALKPGWQVAPYWRTSAAPLQELETSLHQPPLMLKDAQGHLWWPEEGIAEVTTLEPDHAYLIYLTAADTLLWPLNQLASETTSQRMAAGRTPLQYFTPPAGTGRTAHLLLETNGLRKGDEVGVWAGGSRLAGAGKVTDDKVLITIWGDDIATDGAIDGAVEGETLGFSVWSALSGQERPAALEWAENAIAQSSAPLPLSYQTNSVWRGGLGAVEELLSTFELWQNYPNPFARSTIIRYALPHTGVVRLCLINLRGETVELLYDGEQKAGLYERVLDAEGLASGIYMAELRFAGETRRIKMTLVR